jgi:hypothetical protein
MAIGGIRLEYGIYRDGDNNLDREQAACITQALTASLRDPSVEFVVEDTTARRGFAPAGRLRTERYTIREGQGHDVQAGAPRNPADPATLEAFVARTLERAQQTGASQTWIELVDHGAGDGGGLESEHHDAVMSERGIAGAIAAGVARHAREHPEDAARTVDGVVANMCLMNTLGFADALSRAGVRYLAASPEIMLAPGVPSSIATDIAANADDPAAMASAVVRRTMESENAAAFDVIDTLPQTLERVRDAVKRLDDDLAAAVQGDAKTRSHVRGDIRAVRGMARCERAPLPWRADRPALGVYEKLAGDARLPQTIRTDARVAADAVSRSILAHAESRAFLPFGGIDYSDARGPTVHAPLSEKQVDPWAPQVSETANAFWTSTDGDRLAGALC